MVKKIKFPGESTSVPTPMNATKSQKIYRCVQSRVDF